MYILCGSLLCTSLDILASLPWSPPCSIQCSLLCSLPFAGLTGVISLTSVTGLTEKQYELYIFAKKFKYPVYHLFLSAEYQFKFWSYLLLLLLLQLVSELEGSSYAALVGSLMISFRLANLLINNLDFHTFLLLKDKTYHYCACFLLLCEFISWQLLSDTEQHSQFLRCLKERLTCSKVQSLAYVFPSDPQTGR